MQYFIKIINSLMSFQSRSTLVKFAGVGTAGLLMSMQLASAVKVTSKSKAGA